MDNLLNLLIQVLFVFLGFITAVDYLRHKDSVRRDTALMFGVLSLVYVFPALAQALGVDPEWANTLASVSLTAQPFLLLRLVQYFYPIPPALVRLALISMLISWIALIFADTFSGVLQVIAFLAIIAYFAAVDAYAMYIFLKTARTSFGVVRQRMIFAATGSGLLAATLLGLALSALIQPLQHIFVLLTAASAIGAALSYYIGFVPPRWLRRTWQFAELRVFLLQLSSKPIGERLSVDEILNELCRGINHSVGCVAVAIAQEDETQQQWSLAYTTNKPEIVHHQVSSQGIIAAAIKKKGLVVSRLSSLLTSVDKHLFDMVGADTVLATPVAIASYQWGILLVFFRHTPLFIEDDIELIQLLTHQCTVFLENSGLVFELSRHSEQLEKEVLLRTLELEESKEGYRRIVETAQEGIWVTDAENKTTFVNAKVCEMLGYTPEELLALPPIQLIDEESQILAAEKRKQRREGIKDQYEMKFWRKDGTELYALVSAAPLINENGHHIGALAMIADITERKRAEEQILQLNAELEERVAERTSQLTALNKELEAFSYSVSHDLRAPLRALDGFSQALLEDYSDHLDKEGQNYLQRIRAASQRMGNLIDDLLQLSRLSRAEVQFTDVEISKLVREISAELQERYPQQKVDLVIEDDLVVYGDKGLIRAAIGNLLNNAWKFTGKNTQPRIEFGVSQENEQTVFFIKDNGVGFDMTYANKLFGAFQRLHSNNEFEGTGIGLATVQRIIHRHNGQIWAQSAVGQGATFYFTL